MQTKVAPVYQPLIHVLKNALSTFAILERSAVGMNLIK